MFGRFLISPRGYPRRSCVKSWPLFERYKRNHNSYPAPLTAQEILSLANKRAVDLRHQARPLAEAQYQALLQAIQVEVEAKGILIEDYPRGD